MARREALPVASARGSVEVLKSFYDRRIASDVGVGTSEIEFYIFELTLEALADFFAVDYFFV